MNFILCISFSEFHSMYGIAILPMINHSMHCILWISSYTFHWFHLIICISFHAFNILHFFYACHSMHFIFCISCYAFHSMHFVLCISFYAFHSMLFILWISFFTLWTKFRLRVQGWTGKWMPGFDRSGRWMVLSIVFTWSWPYD
jgi:hypothetical protein